MINRFLLGLGALLLGILVVTHARAATEVSATATEASAAEDELCPDIEAAKKDTPVDVASVQADIERLNLCVERAKLLKQLDDIAKDRSKVLEEVTNPGMNSAGMGAGMGGMGIIPTLPTSSLPSLPQAKDLKPGEVRIRQAADNPLASTGATAQPQAAGTTWKIRRIWGQAGGVSGATMRAQLSDGRGSLLNVVKGDPLPDGQVVESVSIKGVTLSQSSSKGSGKINDLSWEETADSATSAGSNAGSTISVPLTP